MKRIIFTALVFILLLSSASFAAEIVIANNSVPVDALSKEKLKNIYLGKKSQWDNGNKIVVVMLKKGPVHENFIKNMVKKSAAQFSSFWKKLIFTGKGKPPKAFATEAELVKYVSETADAIGYIDEATAHENVKVIAVN